MDRAATRSGDRWKTIILVGVISSALIVYVLYQQHAASDRSANRALVAAGLPAPDFAFPDLDNNMVRLSDLKGKVVFLNIWATWCSPCREEMPSMEKLYQEMKGHPFEILAVSIDSLGAKAVGPFMKEFKLSFPALLDPQGTIQQLYGTTGIPESFIIDGDGTIVAKVIGARDWAAADAVRALKKLAQKPAGEKSGSRNQTSGAAQ